MTLTLCTRLAWTLLLAGPVFSCAQTTPTDTSGHIETAQELAARLTPAQRQKLDDAGTASAAQRYPEALALYRQLLQELPGDAYLSKTAAQSALGAGNNEFARDSLKPIVLANLEDWQAVMLLIRACAQSGDVGCRNASMINLAMLHSHGITPAAKKEYLVEVIAAEQGSVQIFASLEPYSDYKVYDRARILDPKGGLLLQLTLESSDFDQPGFAKEHPKEAAAGLRQFSLDGYKDTGINAAGQKTQSHYTFKFLVGQPSYDQVRQEFIDIASGKTKAVSSRDGLIVQ